MRVLCIGDPHFKTKNSIQSDEFVEKTLELVKRITPNFVVVLGDILHTHEKIHVTVLKRANLFFLELSKLVPLFILIGNHDRINNSDFLSDTHAFSALKNWKNVYVIDTAQHYLIEGINMAFVPYVPPGRFQEALDTLDIPTEDLDVIFAHQEFKGAKMGAYISEDGDEWIQDNPLVISGHIHDYQNLENIIYTGTPMQHGFGDTSDKTVSLFTFHNPFSYSQERIDLGLLKRKTRRITCDQLDTFTPPQNCILKVIISGTLEEITHVKRLPKIQELKDKGYIITYKTAKRDIDISSLSLEENKEGSYLQRLRKRIERDNDSRQISHFNRLFS